MRSRLYLTRPKADDGAEVDEHERVLCRVKANYSGTGDQIRLRWRDGLFQPIDANTGIFGTISRRSAERVFLELLAAVRREGRTVSEKLHSGNYAPRIFARRPEREGFQKADFQRAMESLFAQGKIRVDLYGDRPSRQFERIVQNGLEDGE